MQKSGNSNLITTDQAGQSIQNPDSVCSSLLNSAVPWWVPSDFQHLTSLNQEHQNSAGNRNMNSEKGKEANISAPSSVDHQQKGHFEITLAQSMVTTNACHPPQLYGLFTSYGPHHTMGPMMLPMTLATEEGTVYVNPKQYHGILRRRRSRAKAALKEKCRPSNKPYRHESRHLHALRRPRGAGGRFLNSKELQPLKELPPPTTSGKNYSNDNMTVTKNKKLTASLNDDHLQISSNPSGSSSSDVLQNPNPNPSVSEITSSLLLYERQFDWFQPKFLKV